MYSIIDLCHNDFPTRPPTEFAIESTGPGHVIWGYPLAKDGGRSNLRLLAVNKLRELSNHFKSI